MNKSLSKKFNRFKGEFGPNLIETLKIVIVAIGMAFLLKGTIAEARFIPSSSMEPNLNIDDRVLVEKLATNLLKRPVKRGDILVFYPPEIETGLPDNGLLGRFIPFLPEKPPAFIKRVIGLPGDEIVIKSGVGTFVNGKLLEIPGAAIPDYDLSCMGDIHGYAMTGKFIRPYAGNQDPIVVPQDSFFMLGDNRNMSADSHVWGFVKNDRLVGRACLVFWKNQWVQSLFHSS